MPGSTSSPDAPTALEQDKKVFVKLKLDQNTWIKCRVVRGQGRSDQLRQSMVDHLLQYGLSFNGGSVRVADLVVVVAGRALDDDAQFNETNSATENGRDERTPILMFHKREWNKQVHLMYARVLRFSRTARHPPRPP